MAVWSARTLESCFALCGAAVVADVFSTKMGIRRLSKLDLAICSVTALLICPVFFLSARCVHATSLKTKFFTFASPRSLQYKKCGHLANCLVDCTCCLGSTTNNFWGVNVDVSVESVLLFHALYRGDIEGKKQRKPL